MALHMRSVQWLAASSLVCLLVLASCSGNPGNSGSGQGSRLKGKITISGAFALYPMAVRWAEEFQKIHPRVKINISAGGAGKGMADALSGMVDLGMFSKEVSPEEQAKGAWWVGVAKDAVVPTINASNPDLRQIMSNGMTRQELYDIFITGRFKTWGEALGTSSVQEINVFTRSDACGAADMWARYLNGKKQEDLLGIGVNGDPGLADALRKTPSGIGYNNLNFVYDVETKKKYPGLEVIPIDVNGNHMIDPEEDFYGTLDRITMALSDGRYPSPPARELYFVSNGKPTSPVTLAFLKWILTDGQKFVKEAGYVAIPEEHVRESLEKLK
jgi:phosphate transport system substrate-binding protein